MPAAANAPAYISLSAVSRVRLRSGVVTVASTFLVGLAALNAALRES